MIWHEVLIFIPARSPSRNAAGRHSMYGIRRGQIGLAKFGVGINYEGGPGEVFRTGSKMYRFLSLGAMV